MKESERDVREKRAFTDRRVAPIQLSRGSPRNVSQEFEEAADTGIERNNDERKRDRANRYDSREALLCFARRLIRELIIPRVIRFPRPTTGTIVILIEVPRLHLDNDHVINFVAIAYGLTDSPYRDEIAALNIETVQCRESRRRQPRLIGKPRCSTRAPSRNATLIY
jgi:hypothetical protein